MNLPQRAWETVGISGKLLAISSRAVFELIDLNEILFAACHAFLMQY
jgi:hypothetical protein